MCAYDVYKADIRPKGFRVVEFDDYITEDAVRRTRQVLQDKDLSAEMAAHNYEIARRHYSFSALERLLSSLLERCLGG